MRSPPRTFVVLSFMVCVCSSGLPSDASTQAQERANSASAELIVTRLVPPVYPPIARMAHVTGDVEVTVAIKRDGSFQSAGVRSGPPLLRSVTLRSAQDSRYECRGCTSDVTEFPITYSFRLEWVDSCSSTPKAVKTDDGMQVYPQMAAPGLRVTIVDTTIVTCDPARPRVRSIKCVFLWKCGYRRF